MVSEEPTTGWSRWRVKLYHLANDGNWSEIGTGTVRQKVDDEGNYFMFVDSETAGAAVLLESKLSSKDIYDRQNGEIYYI